MEFIIIYGYNIGGCNYVVIQPNKYGYDVWIMINAGLQNKSK